jgi:hypothetical protein
MTTPPKRIYIEAWKTGIAATPWCAETSLVNPTSWTPANGTEGYYDFDQWPTWYKLEGKLAVVIFVSNHEFTWAEAVQISADILAGKVRRYWIDLSAI